MASYQRPRSLGSALEALAAAPRTVLAGGTDFYPARVGRPCDDGHPRHHARSPSCAASPRSDGHWRIGALTTWTDAAARRLPPLFDGLKPAAREVGGVQIQNAGTVGGNLCNASPAADGVPPLLALDAEVELASRRGRRALPLAEFVLGNRRTALRPDELVTRGPGAEAAAARALGHFVKLGARRYLVISIVMVAAALEVGRDGRIAVARLAVGACSPVARRLPAARAGAGRRALRRPAWARLSAARASGAAGPIDDVRASAAYRRDAALTLVRRAVAELAARL